MKTSYDKAGDGRRLIKVVFDRQSTDAATVTVEVIYEVAFPNDFRLSENVPVLTFISATRTDTRERVILRKEESDRAQQEAAVKAVEATSNDFR